MYTYMYTYICVYMNIYTYTHTYIYTYINVLKSVCKLKHLSKPWVSICVCWCVLMWIQACLLTK